MTSLWREKEGLGAHFSLASSPKRLKRSAMTSLWVEKEKPDTWFEDMRSSCIEADAAGNEGGEEILVDPPDSSLGDDDQQSDQVTEQQSAYTTTTDQQSRASELRLLPREDKGSSQKVA